MTKTVAIIISPEGIIRGAFLNLPQIFKKLGFDCLIFANITKNSDIILPNNVTLYEVYHFPIMHMIIPKLPRLLRNIMEQFLIMLSLIKTLRKVDLFLFSHVLMPIPMIGLKLFNKKTLVLVGGVSYLAVPSDKIFIKKMTFLLEDIQYRISDTILVVSKAFIKSYPLMKYKNKVYETPIVMFDVAFYKRFNFSLLSNRENVIGFIGRLDWEKGILEFVDSLPYIFSERKNIRILIIGDGSLKNVVTEKIKTYNFIGDITVLPWVIDVEQYLKQIRLLIIPSKTEGIPSIMIEAMASGTPVLATLVGAIPDIIKEKETGFLLKSNNPMDLADRIVELINKPDLLQKVSINAYNYVRDNFSLKKTLKNWSLVLIKLGLINDD